MISNQGALLAQQPIRKMHRTKRRSEAGYSFGLSECGYDIRIDQDVTFTPGSFFRRPQIEVTNSPAEQENTNVLSKTVLGRFTLASALEEFDMPKDLLGVVHDKSSWARQGLSVFNTVIEPGWKGFLTLELVFHGNKPLTIERGTGIAQVLFHRLATPVAYEGVYQNQKAGAVPAKQAS